MSDHSLPLLTSPYADYTANLKARLDDLLLALDPAYTTASNFPTRTQRFNSALSKWQTFDGSAWADSATTYAISIGGNSATATALAAARTINGVSFNGSANINVNNVNSLTFNNAGSGDVSGTAFNGGSAKTVSYNTVGAPSVTGANASGTWAISVSGNAATATELATARAINGVDFNGSTAISINLNNAATFNNSGSGVSSGSSFDGSVGKVVSYNTLGAASLTGSNATGTWPISINGNAATVSLIPSGAIMMFALATPPDGYLRCDGAAVSRTTYAALFLAIGVTFGAGDGSNTFNVPDCRNRVPIGAGSLYAIGNTGGSKDAIVVSHSHTASTTSTDSGHAHSYTTTTYPLNADNGSGPNTMHNPISGTSGTGYANITSTTTVNSSGVSGTNANLPPYLSFNVFIKF